MTDQNEQDRPPMTAMDFVQMWMNMFNSNWPGQGHYRESVHCRKQPGHGKKDDLRSRCARCDAEALLAKVEPRYAKFQEGDTALLRVEVARANREQAFIGFESMEGPYSIRVPISELVQA